MCVPTQSVLFLCERVCVLLQLYLSSLLLHYSCFSAVCTSPPPPLTKLFVYLSVVLSPPLCVCVCVELSLIICVGTVSVTVWQVIHYHKLIFFWKNSCTVWLQPNRPLCRVSICLCLKFSRYLQFCLACLCTILACVTAVKATGAVYRSPRQGRSLLQDKSRKTTTNTPSSLSHTTSITHTFYWK